jgi:hypothetical protein
MGVKDGVNMGKAGAQCLLAEVGASIDYYCAFAIDCSAIRIVPADQCGGA